MNLSVLAALQLHQYGLTPIPLIEKRPILKGWSTRFIERPLQSDEIINGIKNPDGRNILYNNKNIGIVTGSVSNCIVLDFDDLTSHTKLEKLGQLPVTWTVRSNRGLHLYFNYTSEIPSMKLWDSIDILSDKKQVVAPPSLHPIGKKYVWVVSPKQVEKAELPKWLVEYLLENTNNQFKKTSTSILYNNKQNFERKDIQDLIEQIDWIEFYSDITSNIKGQGLWLSSKCPFHDDHHNSFSFNTRNGAWSCFSGCGSGNAIKMLKQIYQIATREAIKLIKGENIYV
ncbi:bifunctional DNA primase/polymerase [Halalkalibacter sp. APA_J-10(15)]|uniref:bifunctional DNA primase/polymerase n=1 Tax=Halalkalibacter sp. APA_J-10(15) TaxID=2933805 RepID=UPI001FF57494|nr:bifunctional DNA primase/polymerase [Halalkalibacter sp. APA_J-10(15)]MCK0473910.1 bifunctional DNA primase/polymerase [Halalkalibacter sp. APA_J-10(15)]